jgi:peptidyl-prolyl cis-trans isomerase B (cyclophilin B)
MKRMILLAALAGLMFGCQSTRQASVMEMIEEQELVQEVNTEEINVVEETPAEDVKPIEEAPVVIPVEEPKAVERNTVMILMKTSKGDIKLELNEEKAPKTVANFLSYVEAGHYTDTVFHRVIDGFMIQGGGFDTDMNQKAAPNTVENEANNGLKNDLGTIAMARTSAPHSAGAQFFINVSNNAFLDYPGQDGWGYCVFGKVVDGMDVVNKIKGIPTGAGDVPKEQILIKEVTVID